MKKRRGPSFRVWPTEDFEGQEWIGLSGLARAAWYVLRHLSVHLDGLPPNPKAIGHLLGCDWSEFEPAWVQLRPMAVTRGDGRLTFPVQVEPDAPVKPRAVVVSRKGQGGPHAECIKLWESMWLEAKGIAYVWDTKQVVACGQLVRKASGALAAVESRARIMLFSPPNPFIAQNQSPAMLSSRWNELGGLGISSGVLPRSSEAGVASMILRMRENNVASQAAASERIRHRQAVKDGLEGA